MKKAFILLFILFITNNYKAQESPNLVDIPAAVFVNNGQTDFDKILTQNPSLKEQVKILHTYNELSHDLTVQYSSFEEYWDRYATQWYLTSLKRKDEPLLLFRGIKNNGDEREYIELFDMKKKRNHRLLFTEVGRLLAYKTHPLTKEVILYSHKYPCCKSASHNIYRIRQTNEGLKVNDRFFVGRDSGDMVGPFFPEVAKFSSKYNRLTKKTALRWSPDIVNQNAFEGWAESNLMIHYNKGALYKVLYEKDNWQFVVFFNGIVEEQSRVLNYTNFKNKGVYGWIKV